MADTVFVILSDFDRVGNYIAEAVMSSDEKVREYIATYLDSEYTPWRVIPREVDRHDPYFAVYEGNQPEPMAL